MTEIVQPTAEQIRFFLTESFWIEGAPLPTTDQIYHTREFLKLDVVRLQDLAVIVGTYQPGALLRSEEGMDVEVGDYVAPSGGADILARLEFLFYHINDMSLDPWALYCRYEALHPWTDGNGRSGRALWAWARLRAGHALDQGFLNPFHYETLERHAR